MNGTGNSSNIIQFCGGGGDCGSSNGKGIRFDGTDNIQFIPRHRRPYADIAVDNHICRKSEIAIADTGTESAGRNLGGVDVGIADRAGIGQLEDGSRCVAGSTSCPDDKIITVVSTKKVISSIDYPWTDCGNGKSDDKSQKCGI